MFVYKRSSGWIDYDNYVHSLLHNQAQKTVFNPFTADPVKALHFAILVWPSIFNFWHSGALALRTERQSARMSEIKNGGLDQYGAEPFEQQQFRTAGVEGLMWRFVRQQRTSSWWNGLLRVAAQWEIIHETLTPFNQIAAVRRVQCHTGLTHYFIFLTFGRSGAHEWAPCLLYTSPSPRD